jgi:hypothetical protein
VPDALRPGAGRQRPPQCRPVDRALPTGDRRMGGPPARSFFNANTFDDLAEAERLAAIDDRA